MQVIKIDPHNPKDEIIAEAVNVLRDGGVLAYPTDTCYGLGADMTNFFAVDKLYKIKGRESGKPISVIVKSVETIKKIALVEEKQEKFIKKFLPGPLTLILLNTDYQNFKKISLGIRIPRYKITQLLAEEFNRPYATTSANITGMTACYSAEDIIHQFSSQKYQPDLILDAGRLDKNPPSTVVDLIKWPPRVLRQGGLVIDLENIL